MPTQKRFSLLRKAAWTLILLVVGAGAASAQSADRDHPTRLTGSEVSGDAVASNTEYFYSFTAGPGVVTITPGVSSNDFSTAFTVDLFDGRNNSLGGTTVSATHRNSEVGAARSVRLTSRQHVLMRLRFDGNASRYSVRLGGAALNMPTEAAPANRPMNTATERATSRGTLRIEMEDGSVHEFDLARVRQAMVRP
ncbi:MAG: hypothetical protein WKF84_27535 [Pyrinomonadaceae bacterium]